MDVKQRFSYVRYDDVAAKDQEAFKRAFEDLTLAAERNLADGRAKSLVLTKLEEAYMWIGKAIRDDQIERTGKIEHEPARGE